MLERRIINGKEVRLWLPWEELGERGQNDIINLLSLPFITRPIAILPDAHVGYGVCIGSVIPTNNYLIPNAVGSDCGCGMSFVSSNLDASKLSSEILRKEILRQIRKRIPLDAYHSIKQSEEYMPQGSHYEEVLSKAPVCSRKYDSSLKMIGTLGGGNHFLELQKNSEGKLCIMVHSGSRGLGGYINELYTKLAKKYEDWFFLV